jgi:hypothetical protein
MSEALKLFVVKDSSGAIVMNDGEPLYFADKMEAKNHRWLVGTTTSGHTIGYGPSHHKYSGKGANT